MRVGVVILPDQRWAEAARRWRSAEQFGFDHAWTYDHIGWRSLVDGPWFDAAVTLTAAAGVTETIRLGTMVASPHFRHPVPFARVVTALDDVSGGRFTLGVGAGTVGAAYDAVVQGQPVLSDRARTDRFAEFLDLLDRLLREDRASAEGQYFSAVDARSTPGCVQVPRVPFVVAANGPRAQRLAARYGQGWVTTGGAAQTLDGWWRTVGELSARFTEALTAAGRDPATVDRYLNLDSAPVYSLSSVAAFVDAVGRAAELGFTDVLTHWPRRATHEVDWYVGDESVLETVAAEVLPGVRAR
jgi:alkanesulfonate monooxygenase SsuD/methylene tetrahydromethanopterin reductase-like flavin-dependent oxidoreductase (luciferase family)